MLTIEEVMTREYEKFATRVEKYGAEVSVENMSDLELAGNVWEEFKGDMDQIRKYVKKLFSESKGADKFRFYTIIDLCDKADHPAVELFEYSSCSLPGTLIIKICSESKGYPISDSLHERYINPDTATQNPLNLRCYYSVKQNVKMGFYYVQRDLKKSPRKSPAEKPAGSISIDNNTEATNNEEKPEGVDEQSENKEPAESTN